MMHESTIWSILKKIDRSTDYVNDQPISLNGADRGNVEASNNSIQLVLIYYMKNKNVYVVYYIWKIKTWIYEYLIISPTRIYSIQVVSTDQTPVCWLMRQGLLTAVRDVLRVREDGLLVGGPPCGPWVFINSATHARKKDAIFGDVTKEYVKSSNMPLYSNSHLVLSFGFEIIYWWCFFLERQQTSWLLLFSIFESMTTRLFHCDLRLVARWALLLLLAGIRCVYTLTEQPGSSLMPRYDYIKYVATIFQRLLGVKWASVFLPDP